MRPLKVASLFAFVVAFTACTDSPERTITEPGGVHFSSHGGALTSGQLALLGEIMGVQQKLYACVKSAGKSDQKKNKANDIKTMKEYAEAGWWDSGDNSSRNVAAKANQIINDTKGLVQNGSIPATCPAGGYGRTNEPTRTELANYFYLLLELFASQGESLGDFPGEVAGIVACPNGGCEELNEEAGWGVSVPPGTFGQSVAILVRENLDVPAPDNYNAVGNSFHFDVFPSTAVANNPWTRCIVWAGENPGTDDQIPAFELVKMIRQDEDGVEELTTHVNACGDPGPAPEVSSRNPFVRGAYALFAGFPFLPKELHAYSPPRTFGGTSLKSSPHWLTVEESTQPESQLFGSAFIDGEAASLYVIDATTGAGTLVGAIGFNRVGAMDFHPTTGVLYATGQRQSDNTPVLITINPQTGAGTEVGPTGISGGNISDIAFRSDGVLFVFDATAASHTLYTVNLSTGAAAIVGATGLGSNPGNGMVFDAQGVLRHSNRDFSHTLSQTTGAATQVTAMSFPSECTAFAGPGGRVAAAVRDGTGDGFIGAITCGTAGTGNFLGTVNYSSGEVTLIGSTVAGLDGLAIRP